MRTRHVAAFLLVAALALSWPPADAREADGSLGFVQTPNNGIPAIVAPGGAFDAVLKTKAASLSLTGTGGAIPLAVEWTPVPGAFRARCTTPMTAAPGTYSILAETTTGDSQTPQTDQIPRAVFVREAFPDYYIVAHLTDVHIGDNRDGVSATDIFANVLKAVNESPAAFAVITGDLTHSGEPEQFQQLLATMDSCTIPTFVCPGNHDRTLLHYERFFGPNTYMFRFGPDGYLAFDTKDFLTADALGKQDADIEILRRDIKACRWSIGLTHRFEPDMSMRVQLILFVDNPLDHLFFGHWHQANTEEQKTVPWGTTPITVTPAAIDSQIRFVDVSSLGVKPRPPEKTTEQPQKDSAAAPAP